MKRKTHVFKDTGKTTLNTWISYVKKVDTDTWSDQLKLKGAKSKPIKYVKSTKSFSQNTVL